MGTILYLSIFWIAYGIVGLLGFQIIPPKFKGHRWTKDYIRCQGKGWLVLGIPWLVLSLVLPDTSIGVGITMLIMIAAASPSLIYSVLLDKKYNVILANEKENNKVNC